MKNQTEMMLAAASQLRLAGRLDEAIAAYSRLLAVEPALPDCWYNLGMTLRARGRFQEALDAYGEALARGVAAPEEVRLNRAVLLADHLRRETEAELELRQALKNNPGYAPAWLNLGDLLEGRGDREGAAACYSEILAKVRGAELDDFAGEALSRLGHLRPPKSLDDPLLGRIAAAASSGAIGTAVRANLYFALGRALDALGGYDRAFAAFTAANRCVHMEGPPYNRSAIARTVDQLVDACPAPARRTVRPTPAPLPVFVCGMYRSGSTLAEQALAAHPQVTPGGELNLLNRMAEKDLAPYPQSIRTLSDERAAELGDAYRRELIRLFPDSANEGSIVTDKRPDNFLRIGLIKRLFPGAKIVHTVRDPVDTCLSVFFEHLDQGVVGYASDLGDCGRYYGQYRRMMSHWKSLYAGDILDFEYDRFVADPRPELERLLSFLGLDWDERCLSFHELRNPVKTASYWQVRRPLYKNSSGRRQHYLAHLEPLLSALREAGVEIA